MENKFNKVVSIILLIGILGFISGFLWQPKSTRLHTFYYLLVVLPSILLIPLFYKEQLHKNKIFILVFSFLIYSVLSVFWAEPYQSDIFIVYFKRSLFLILLIYSIHHLILYYPNSEKILFVLLMIGGFGLSSYSIMKFFYDGGYERLIVWGVLDNPIASATVFGALFLLSARAYLREKNNYLLLVYMSLCLLFALEMLLTKSRGPQLALILTLPFFFYFERPAGYKRIIYPLSIIVVSILALLFMTNIADDIFSRGLTLSYRDDIWSESIQLSLEKPIFGYGLGADINFYLPEHDVYVTHSHNFILSTWLKTGLVGVFLLLGMIYLTLKVCVDHRSELFSFWGVIMVFGIICLLTNSDYIISRPNERWFVFWIPLAFIIAHSFRRSE